MEYLIQKGDRVGQNTILTVESKTDAYTEDFDLEIEWGFGDVAAGQYGIGSVDGRERAFVDDDGQWWHATPIEGDGDTIDSEVSPFVALAHLAYIENW